MTDERNAPTDFDHSILPNLIERYVAEQITEAECEQLHGFLAIDPEWKDYLRRQLDTDHLLREMLTSRSRENASSGIMEWCALRAFATTEPEFDEHAKPSSRVEPEKSRQSFFMKRIVVPILLLVAVFAIYSEFFSTRSSMPKYETFARIEETIDVRWGEGNTVFKPGSNIGNEIIRFEKGIVKITIQNGAELILEGPIEFIVSGKLRTFCQKGKVNAVIPGTARNFELTTPFSRIVDFGTEFSVVVDGEATDIHMIEGKAEISRDRNHRMPLLASQAVRTPKTGEIEPLPLDRGVCIRNDYFEKLLKAFLVKRAKSREAENARFVDDPDILCRFDGNGFQGPGTLLGGKQIDLNRQDRSAVRFKNVRDRIEMNIPGRHASLTLLMMVRIHSLDHVSRLLISDDYYENAGTVLWQLSQNGDIQFHVHSNGDEKFLSFDVPRGFQPKDLSTWTMLAVTVDAEKRVVRHYKDGLLVAEIPCRTPQSLSLENLTVGNESRQGNKRISRFLNADIAELQLYRRVLGEKEIKEIHENIF